VTDHYELLGVDPGASHDEIRRAYHGLARRHHPDAHSGAPAAAIDAARRRMAGINAAWTVLGDPARRQAYDARFGHRRPSPPPGAEPAEDAPPPEYPDWFEPDEEVAAAHLEEDVAPVGRAGPAQLLVFVPVGLAALAIAAFALSVVVSSRALFGLALALVPVTLVTFLAAPFVAMAGRSRATD
jgi:hypothetical protein